MKTKLSEQSKHTMYATCKHLSIKSLFSIFIVLKQKYILATKTQLTSSNNLRNTVKS